MMIEPAGRHELEVFAEEIHAAVRYERGLVVKALGVLAVLAVIGCVGTVPRSRPRSG